MADRVIGLGNTLNEFRTELNGTAADVGDIADVLSASSFIASSTDLIEAIVAISPEIPEIRTDAFIFPGRVMAFEGATDDAFETTLTFTEPTGDRTHTMPDANGGVMLETNADTSSNKTLTTPTITSAVLNTSLSGSAFKDQDDMSSDSATSIASQQSIKAYVDSEIDTEMDLVFTTDSGNGQITMDSETLTLAGGTGIDSVGSGNTLTFNIANTVSTLVGSDTFTNKTLTSATLTSPVLNTAVSGTAVLDEDNMSSNSATKTATQQSIKAYVDAQTTLQDLDIAPDSGTAQSIDLDGATLTFSGGTEVGTSASGTTVTLATTSNVVTKTGSQTLSNKTFTAPNLSSFTLTGTNTGLNVGAGGIIFEGATADAHETTLIAAEPGQDNTITIPDTTMTLVTTATHATRNSHITNVIALG
jgi:hypothetical protein